MTDLSPAQIVKLYADGQINVLELHAKLQAIICDENIAETMHHLGNLKNPERRVKFVEDILGLVAAIDAGERIFQFHGPDLTKEEGQNLRERLACLIRYMENSNEVYSCWN